MSKKYGITQKEIDEQSNIKCLQIVKTIVDYGVSEKQKLKLIFNLALELENHDYMVAITDCVKRCEDNDTKSTLITKIE